MCGACGPGMPRASLHKAQPRHLVPSATVPLSMLSVLGLILTQKHPSLVITGKQDCFTPSHPCLSLSLDLGAHVFCKKVTRFQFTLWLIQMHCVSQRQRQLVSGDVAGFPEGSLREWVSLLSGTRSRQHLTHVRNKASRWKRFAVLGLSTCSLLSMLVLCLLYPPKPALSHVPPEDYMARI